MKLLDRKAERQAIRGFLFADPAPGVRVLVIEGEAGVGKSELLRFGASAAGDNAFRFEDGRRVHTCRRGQGGVDFAALGQLVGELARRHGRAFGVGMDKAAGVATAPMGRIVSRTAAGLPYLGGIDTAFEADRRETTASKASLLELARVSHQSAALTKFLADALRGESPDGRLVLALDDVHLADELSLRTLLSAVRRLGHESVDVRLLAAGEASATAGENGRPLRLDEVVRDYQEVSIQYLCLENLGRGETEQVLAEAGRGLNSAESDYVYEVTEGNFAFISRLLRQPDERLRLMYRNWLADRELHSLEQDPLRTKEELNALLGRAPGLRSAFAILALLGNEVTVVEMGMLWPALEGESESAPRRRAAAVSALLEPAVQAGDVQVIGDYVIAERRALEAARSMFLRDGSYVQFGRTLAARLLVAAEGEGEGIPLSRAVSRALQVLTEFDPGAALEALDGWWHETGLPAARTSPDVLQAGAIAFEGVATQPEAAGWSSLGERLLVGLRAARRFGHGARVGTLLANRVGVVEAPSGFRVLRDYIVCLRESGQLAQINVVSHLDQLEARARTVPERIEALLLGATVWEHLADFDRASASVTAAEALLSEVDGPEQPTLTGVVARHLGLRDFHGDVVERCLDALSELPKGSTDVEDRVLRGSLYNHVGLGYYHTGRLQEADAYFQRTLDELGAVGLRTETPLNNLGACKVMLGDLDEGLDLFEAARDLPTKPAYQSLSIDINYALCLFKLGNQELAKNILRPIADGGRPVPDPYVRSQAQCTLAYCHMRLNSHTRAAELYAASNRCSFRFLAREQEEVRRLMAQYCAAKAGIIEGEYLGDLSLVDLAEDGAVPVRRPYQLDLNSLYVT